MNDDESTFARKMNNIVIDTKRLIAEVRLRPALWDMDNTSYKDRDARLEYWREVNTSLFPDFDEYDESKKKDIEKQVQQRWKTARDAYMRCKSLLKSQKCGVRAGRTKPYAFYNQMTFLKRRHVRHIEDSIRPEELNNKINTNTPSTRNKRTTKRESNTEDNCTLADENENSHSTKRRKFTSDSEFDREVLKMLKQHVEIMTNDDMSFFRSLLPITAKFSSYQKLQFRSAILDKAMELVRTSVSYDDSSGHSGRPSGRPVSSNDPLYSPRDSSSSESGADDYVGVEHKSKVTSSLSVKHEHD